MSMVDGGDAFSTYGTGTASGIASGATLMGRRVAENLMDSTVTIVRNGAVVTDPDTGVDTPAQTTIYEGVCRLRFPDSRASEVSAAGQEIAVQSPVLSLPVLALGSADVRPDDIATVISPLDPTPVVVRIAGVHTMTHATARRFPVEVQA